jgi:hypothetical protein
MRKFILCFAALAMMLMFGSCDKEKGIDPNLIYNVTANAEGKVDFSWFNGGASIDGTATVFQCNDTLNTKKFLTEQSMNEALLLTDALKSDNKKIQESAAEVNKMITVNGIEGEYHLSIKGYVKYGPMIFRIDEEWPKQ